MRDLMKLCALALVALGLTACATSGADHQNAATIKASSSTPAFQNVSGGLDWPHYRGPNSNGISAETGINKDWGSKPPKLLWKVDMTDGGYSGPAVADGVVYVIDHDGDNDVVRALNLADGTELWRYRYAEPKPKDNGFTRSTPTVQDGKVYTMSRLGLACCLDAKTGKAIWTRDLVADFNSKRPGWDLACSPVIDGQNVILCPGGDNAGMVALDKDTGKNVWQGGGTTVSGYSTPVIATINGVKQYVVFVEKAVMGVNAQNGKVLWSTPWETSYGVNAMNPIVIGNTVYVSSGYGHGCALYDISAAGPTKVWETKEMQAQFSCPVLFEGLIYGTSDPGVLMCLDPKTGQAKWKQPGFEKGGCVAVDGTIIAMNGSNGDIFMAELSPDGYKELGHLTGPLGGQSWTAPIVAQGKLIIRNTKAVACLDLR
jgi:outer membrane protein assembly factor BamB